MKKVDKLARKWVNKGEWGYPDDRTGQWMFDKLVEAFKAGYKKAIKSKNKKP